MSGHYPPLTCDEFKSVLETLGFVKRKPKSGSTHEDWVATIDGRFRKVTVDCPKAPFSQDLISSMAKQAGVTKKRIYEIHFGYEEEEQKSELSPVPKRFEAKRQDGTDFWCVWDTQANASAFGGAFNYLTEEDAIAQAARLCLSH
jgi:hypothetical protein